MLIFRRSRSQMFSKWVFLKISQHWSLLLHKHVWWLLLDFHGSRYFFSVEFGIYCWQSHWFLFWTPLKTWVKLDKPLKLFCKKRVQKLCKFHRKTPMLKSLFTKVVGLKACSFIKTRLQHRYFPVKFTKFLKTRNLKSICERLLLKPVLAPGLSF